MDAIPFIICAIIGVSLVLMRRAIAGQMKKSSSMAAIGGFNPVVKYDGIIGGHGIAIDPETNRFALSRVGGEPHVFDFSQVVAVDVERDGATITTTKGSNGLAGAAVGVALLGPAGLLLGSGTRSRGLTKPTVTKLSMKIYVNDLIKPYHEVVFYKNPRGGSANGIIVTKAAQQLDEWYGRFRTILAMQAPQRAMTTDQGTRPDDVAAPALGADWPVNMAKGRSLPLDKPNS